MLGGRGSSRSGLHGVGEDITDDGDSLLVTPIDRGCLALLSLFVNGIVFGLQHFLNSLPCLFDVFESALLLGLKHLDAVV